MCLLKEDLSFRFSFGSYGSQPSQFPFCVAVSPTTGRIAVTASGNRVQVFDPTGKFIREFGLSTVQRRVDVSPGMQFSLPWGIAIDKDDNYYVSDSANCVVQKFDSQGNFIACFGSPGKGVGQFTDPRGLCLDSDNNLWVADSMKNEVTVFSPEGTFLRKLTSGACGVGFHYPHDVKVGRDGRIIIAHAGKGALPNAVHVFDHDGKFLHSLQGPGFDDPMGIAIDCEGKIAIAEHSGSRVSIFGPDGKIMKFVGINGVEGQFATPLGIAIDLEGNLLVVDSRNSRVQVFGGKRNELIR